MPADQQRPNDSGCLNVSLSGVTYRILTDWLINRNDYSFPRPQLISTVHAPPSIFAQESEKVASFYIILLPSAIDSISEHSKHELLISLHKYFPVITVHSTGYLSLPWHIAMGPVMGIRGCDSAPLLSMHHHSQTD